MVGHPPFIGLVKLNFNGCSFRNPGQIGIRGVIRNHFGTLLRAYPKQTIEGLAIEVEILTLLEGLLQAKALGLSNLIIEGDSAIVLSWVINKERGSWKFDN